MPAAPKRFRYGTFIREWRDDRGLTQQRLADRIERSSATVSRIETGTQGYTQPILGAIADALQCTPGDLLTRRPGDPYGIHAVLGKLTPDQLEQAERILKAMAKVA